jgi:hypothetical protein
MFSENKKEFSLPFPLSARSRSRPTVRESSFAPRTPLLHALSPSRVLWPQPSSAQAQARSISWPGREPTGAHHGPSTLVSMADTAGRRRRILGVRA